MNLLVIGIRIGCEKDLSIIVSVKNVHIMHPYYKHLLIYFCSTQKTIFWRMFGTKELLVPTDFHSNSFFLIWTSMATCNCLVTNILQNNFDNRKITQNIRKTKLIQVWNNLRVIKWWQILNYFWVNCPFKSTSTLKTEWHLCYWLF